MIADVLESLYAVKDYDSPDYDRAGLHFLFDWVEERIDEKNFEALNSLLAAIDVTRLSSMGLMAVARSTFRAKEVLPEWVSYVYKAQEQVEARYPDKAATLLAGLVTTLPVNTRVETQKG